MDQNLATLIADLGAFGVLVWMSIRMTMHTVPRLATDFKNASEEQRKDFKASLDQQRHDFIEAIEKQHDQFMTMFREQRDMFEHRAQREEDMFQRSIERLASAIESRPPPIRLKGHAGGSD